MPRLKIKQLGERVATVGLHLGGGPERRKLEPGEVVDIPEDLYLPDGRSLSELVWATGLVELTLDPVTRPLDYESYKEARFCAPNFKPRDAAEQREMEEFHKEVAYRLSATNVDPVPEPVEKARKAPKATTIATNPRARRRAVRTASHGKKATS